MNTKLNKSDWILLSIIFGVTVLLNGLDYYKKDSKLIEYLIDFPSAVAISIGMIFIFIYILIPKFLIYKKQYILFFISGILVLSFLGAIENFIGRLTGGKGIENFPNLIIYLQDGLYNATDMIGLPLGILLIKKFHEGQIKFLEIQQQQKENELKLLRSQLDPHFLFNNLNTLDSLIDSNSEKAKEYINRLSLIYRYLIQTKDSEVMELSEEITLAENYIFLIKTRFDHDYDFRIERNASIENKFIPTGAIQALLENVVKHNKPSLGNTIKSTIYIENDWLTVTNSKSSIVVKKDSFGTGLENLKTRYQLLSDKEISIINTDNEFKVIIPIIKLSIEN